MVRGESPIARRNGPRKKNHLGNSNAPCTMYYMLHILKTRLSCSWSSATKGISYTSVNPYRVASLKWSKLCLKLPSRFSPVALRYVVADVSKPEKRYANQEPYGSWCYLKAQTCNTRHFQVLVTYQIFWKRNCFLLWSQTEASAQSEWLSSRERRLGTRQRQTGTGPVRGSCAC